MVKDVIARFRYVKVEYVPRAMNAKEDLLSRIAFSSFPTSSREIQIEFLPQKSIEEVVDQLCVEDEPSWMDPLLLYLREERLPQVDSEAQEVRRKARSYVLVNGELYRRSFSQPLLKCIKLREADYILREIHEGICGSHIEARTLSQKALRQGYYWPTMAKDSERLVRTCDKCQRTSNLVHVKYIMASIDYFTKWVEAEAMASITARRVKQFLWKNVVCRFEIPRVLISDNGTQFTDRSVQEWCQELGIRQQFTLVAHPQANRQIELTNRTLLRGLKARVDKADGSWVEELPSILWSYRTTVKVSTGETPFSLCYGSEASIPVEIGVPTLRVELFSPESNEQNLRDNLDLLDELPDYVKI
ncbi:uncharacterized protein LOC127788137 [Diospyros lotus]|uniref:uncharacterized protein LOC127788137 n=1 Tax=Diospyros lotus TaxID=55363 RepID=UPI00225211A4|nr:uncharacterized protein LOC127788137 [Diospyros lotus]